MIKFATTSEPSKPKNNIVRITAYGLAFLYVVFAFFQLFSLDGFINLVSSYNLSISSSFVYFLCCSIIAAEIFALPFLLGSRVSQLMRFVSLASGWLVVVFWAVIQVLINTGVDEINNAGFFGEVITFPVGLRSIVTPVFLGVMMTVVTLGMWPQTIKSKRKV